VTASLAADDNYSAATSAAFSFAIGKAVLTITAKSIIKMYDCNPYLGNGENGVTYNGFLNNEGPSILGGTLIYTILPAGVQNVGTYSITPGGLTSNNYQISFVAGTLTVTPQTAVPVADILYTGQSFAWTTSSTSNTATITLATTLKNTLCGDIATAKVTFAIRNADGSFTPIPSAQNLPVSYVDPSNISIGTASKTVQMSISGDVADIQIAVIVGGNFIANSKWYDGLLTIAVPTPGGKILGRSDICESGLSSGYVKAAPGTVTRISFNVKYSKSFKNPQGAVNVWIESLSKPDGTLDTKLHYYKFKSNAITSLVVNAPIATFDSKANMTEDNKDGTVTSVEGNCIMRIEVIKATVSGVKDQIAVTIYRNKGGVWYSSRWDGAKTIMTNVCAGVISLTGDNSGSSLTSVRMADVQTVEAGVFSLRSYPNPSTSQFNLQLQSSDRLQKVQVRVFDMSGRTVQQFNNLSANQTLQIGSNYRPGMYIVEMIQGDNRKQLKLIKQAN
jgi:trimeric autotransporter adhesin